MLASVVTAQDERTFAWHETQTARFHKGEQWKELANAGIEAISSGYDYYYMRLRTGIALYQMHKYRKAAEHFRKALEWNSEDPLAMEYLFYSEILGGRKAEALIIKQNNQQPLSKINDFERWKAVDNIYVEGGTRIAGSSTEEEDSQLFYHVGLGSQLGPYVSTYFGYSNLSQNIYNLVYDASGNTLIAKERIKYAQNGFYALAKVRAAAGLSVVASFHHQSIDTIGSVKANHSFSASVIKQIPWLDLSLSCVFSRINQRNQRQISGSLTIYPGGLSNVFLESRFTQHHEEQTDRYILYQKAGLACRIGRVEVFYSSGPLFNYSEHDGFYIYNITDQIESRVGVNMVKSIREKHELNAGYLLETRTELSNNAKYSMHVIFGGFNYIF
jgi:tetratricopeptide (TPR) repeat protein